MLDELDDTIRPVSAAPAAVTSVPTVSRRSTSVTRLVCRMYRAAPPPLRTTLLACLVRPLGTLGVVGVAAGAFGVLLYRGSSESARAAVDDVTRLSNDQIFELVRFVEQVSPDALLEFARLFSERSMGLAAFSAAVAWLLIQALRTGNGSDSAEAGPQSAGRDH